MVNEEYVGAIYRWLRDKLFSPSAGPEAIDAPDECPHCGFRPSVFAVQDRNEETVTRSWRCWYCGNGSDSEPERTPVEALERARAQHRRMSEMVAEAERRFRR